MVRSVMGLVPPKASTRSAGPSDCPVQPSVALHKDWRARICPPCLRNEHVELTGKIECRDLTRSFKAADNASNCKKILRIRPRYRRAQPLSNMSRARGP